MSAILKPSLLTLITLLFLATQGQAEMRLWTSKAGSQIEAEVVTATATEVKLRTAEGRIINCRISDLSEADAAYLRGGDNSEPSAEEPDVDWRTVRIHNNTWHTKFSEAKAEATARGLPILALFTNSHSCPPCIAFERNVLDTSTFRRFAQKEVVLYLVDHAENYQSGKPVTSAKNRALKEDREVPAFMNLRGWPHVYIVKPDDTVLFAEKVGSFREPRDFIKTCRENIEQEAS